MKKCCRWMMALMVMLVMGLPAVSGLAEGGGLSVVYLGPGVMHPGGSVPALKTVIHETESGGITFSLLDTKSNTVVYRESRSGVKVGDEIVWNVPYAGNGLTASAPAKRMKAVFSMDGKTYAFQLFYCSDGKKNGDITAERAVWYPDNTACSFGPQFREMRPELTDKWYMFTPLDLSRQGTVELEYIAGNVYVIGKVFVHVSGDTVTVTYENFYEEKGGNTTTEKEFFTFLPDLASVREVEPEKMEEAGFAFGRPVSISNDLGGDTKVLLFIRNRTDYRDYVTDSIKLERFWINLPVRRELRRSMIESMEGEYSPY